jgi:hypothetical protein
MIVSDDGEDVIAELEAQLPGFVPGTFGELLGVSYDTDDYECHSWSRRLRNARLGRPCAQIAGSVLMRWLSVAVVMYAVPVTGRTRTDN